jgi:hypothetical protein
MPNDSYAPGAAGLGMSEAQKYPTYTSEAESGLERLAFSPNHPPGHTLFRYGQ